MEPNFKFKEATSKRRRLELITIDKEQKNLLNTLQELVESGKQMFDQIRTDKYKSSANFQLLLKNNFFGNKIKVQELKDLRIAAIVKSLDCNIFKGKRILDLGCHQGNSSLQIANNYSPTLVIGIDIDRNLVQLAINNMHQIINSTEQAPLQDTVDEQREQKLQDLLTKVSQMPLSMQLALQGEIQSFKVKQPSFSKFKEVLYGRINFRTENYIEKVDIKQVCQEQFDVILCLSTVKWVHLCYGDIGVKVLFLKISLQLDQDGFFLFDQQPWKSYKKEKHRQQQNKHATFGEKIEFKPDMFSSFLQSIGLKLVKKISEGVPKTIYIFQKQFQ